MLVFSFATRNIEKYAFLSKEINSLYCKKHKYEWISEDKERLSGDFDKQWEKVAMSLDLLRRTKKGSWLCWIDADAVFNLQDIPLETFTSATKKDFLICHDGVNVDPSKKDPKEKFHVNTGVMIFKNTKWTEGLFQRWIRTPGKFKKGAENQDQDRFVEMFRANELDMQDHVHVFPANAFNSNYHRPNADTFVVHMMERSMDERIKRFEGILKNLKDPRTSGLTPEELVSKAFLNRQKGGKVAVVTMYDDAISGYAHLSTLINSMYTSKYNYELVTIRERLSDRAPQWDKVFAVSEILKKNAHDFVMWIDADAIFNDFETDLLNDIILKNMENGAEMLVCDDTCNKGIFAEKNSFYPNTGTFVFRNTEWARRFAEFWWQNPEDKVVEKYHEQDMLKKWYEENKMGLQDKLVLLPAQTMNSCADELPKAVNIIRRRDDTFIIHMMATSNKVRENYFRGRLNALKTVYPAHTMHYNDHTSTELQAGGSYENTLAYTAVAMAAIGVVLLIVFRVRVIKKG